MSLQQHADVEFAVVRTAADPVLLGCVQRGRLEAALAAQLERLLAGDGADDCRAPAEGAGWGLLRRRLGLSGAHERWRHVQAQLTSFDVLLRSASRAERHEAERRRQQPWRPAASAHRRGSAARVRAPLVHGAADGDDEPSGRGGGAHGRGGQAPAAASRPHGLPGLLRRLSSRGGGRFAAAAAVAAAELGAAEPAARAPGAAAPAASPAADAAAPAAAEAAARRAYPPAPAHVPSCVSGQLVAVAELPFTPAEAAALASCSLLLVAPDDPRAPGGARVGDLDEHDDDGGGGGSDDAAARGAARAAASEAAPAYGSDGEWEPSAAARAAERARAGADGRERGAPSTPLRRRPPKPVPSAILDPSPSQVVAAMPLATVHVHFALLGLGQAYVTASGRLVGQISRDELIAKLQTLAEDGVAE